MLDDIERWAFTAPTLQELSELLAQSPRRPRPATSQRSIALRRT